MRVSGIWVRVSLLIGLVFSPLHAQVDTANRYVRLIRTQDSVGIADGMPMLSPYNPPRIYSKWLIDIASCEGLPLPTAEQISRVEFWEVNAGRFKINTDNPIPAIAVSDPSGGRMYVSIAHILDEDVIKHEFVHFLLRWKLGITYQGAHLVEYFSKCNLDD